MIKPILDTFEEDLLLVTSRVGPWLAPIGPAYFVGRAVHIHLGAHWAIALIMALAIEFVGIAATKTALRAWHWNQARRKTDPRAPFAFQSLMALGYFITGISLSVLIELYPPLIPLAPAAFFILAAIAYFSLAIAQNLTTWENGRTIERKTAQEMRRIKSIKSELEADQKRARTLQKQISGANGASDQAYQMALLDKANRTKKQRIKARRLEVARLHNAGHSTAEIAAKLGRSTDTILRDKAALNGELSK